MASRLIEHGVGDSSTEAFLKEDDLADAPSELQTALVEWVNALDENWTGPGWYYSAFIFEGDAAILILFESPSEPGEPIERPDSGAAIQTLVWIDAYESIVRQVRELGPDEVAKRALSAAGINYVRNREIFAQ